MKVLLGVTPDTCATRPLAPRVQLEHAVEIISTLHIYIDTPAIFIYHTTRTTQPDNIYPLFATAPVMVRRLSPDSMKVLRGVTPDMCATSPLPPGSSWNAGSFAADPAAKVAADSAAEQWAELGGGW
jgi:hypothetical protein